jgi:large subunit ribosomal protein L18
MKTIKRRRKENKTDYQGRLGLLKSGIPRIVFRKTNKYIISQYVTSKEARDKVKFGLTSDLLLKYGWPKELKGSLKSLPASYLTGFLTGKKIVKEKLETPIIDFGMLRTIHKGKPFAFLKGLKDSGVKIKCDEKSFPGEDRIKGKHMKKDFSPTFEQIKSRIEKE